MPVGGKQTVEVNVRIVAATNRQLSDMVAEGKFRSDLYFRLNVFPIHNPPLRERPEDIEALVQHFIEKHRRRLNSTVRRASSEFLSHLRNHNFPGNIRELENIVERAMITNEGEELRLDFALSGPGARRQPTDQRPPAPNPLLQHDGPLPTFEEMQRQYITSVLQRTNGKVSGPGGAAEVLGLKAQTLFSKMRKLEVNRDLGGHV